MTGGLGRGQLGPPEQQVFRRLGAAFRKVSPLLLSLVTECVRDGEGVPVEMQVSSRKLVGVSQSFGVAVGPGELVGGDHLGSRRRVA